MKKIIAITAMAAMVAAAAMADEPAVDLNVAEISGNATLTWGVDLDEGDTGFKNDTEAKLKVNIANGGSKNREGEGVWAEVEVKVADALVVENGEVKGGKAALENAKIHIGDLYIGLKSGDIKVGEVKLPSAIYADNAFLGTGNVGGGETEGLTVGYGTDDFGLAVDFRSLKGQNDLGAETDYYTNNYGVAAEAELKDSNAFVSGLGVKAGVTYAFEEKDLGLAASASYKLPIGETFYLKPAVAFVGEKVGDAKMDIDLAGSVLFGWGDQADANAGVYYLDNDQTKKVTPGVSVAVRMYDMHLDQGSIGIYPAFYSGDIVPGLKAAVAAEMILPRGYDPAPDAIIGVAGGVSYELAAGDSIKITPKAGFRFLTENANDLITYDADGKVDTCIGIPLFPIRNKDNGAYYDTGDADTTSDAAAKGLLNVKAGVDITGLIENTTFSAWYQSRNLRANKDTDGKIGTFNVSVKVSL